MAAEALHPVQGCVHYRSFSVAAGSFFPINAAGCKRDSNIFGRRPSTSLIVVPQNWQEGIKRVMLQLRGCRYQLPVQQQRGGGIVIVGRYSEDLHRLKLRPHFLQRAGGTLLCLPGRIGGAPARGPQPGDKAKRSDRCEVQNCEPNTGHDAAQDFHPERMRAIIVPRFHCAGAMRQRENRRSHPRSSGSR
jgi:hypothetical protein